MPVHTVRRDRLRAALLDFELRGETIVQVVDHDDSWIVITRVDERADEIETR